MSSQRKTRIGNWNQYIKADRLILSKMSKQVWGMPLYWKQLLETGRRRGHKMTRYKLTTIVYYMHLYIDAMHKNKAHTKATHATQTTFGRSIK